MLAYQNIYASPGNMTKGSDGNTIDAMSLNRIEGIIARLKRRELSTKAIKKNLYSQKEWQETSAGDSVIR